MNLVSLSVIKNKIKNMNLNRLISEVGYANDGNKKYYVILKNTKRKIKFGDLNYDDYLITENKQKRINYRNRHKNDKGVITNNPNYSGFWSWWVLW